MSSVARVGIEQPFKVVAGKLNPLTLKTLKPGDHSDGHGLYLVVQESGSRSWILRTIVRGKRREIGLGGLATKSLAQARTEAGDLRSRAKKGEDIVESRRIEKRVVPTFKEAALIVHASESQNFRSEIHKSNWLRSLDQYVFPIIGAKTVDAIETGDILRAIGTIWSEVPDTARRTLRRIKKVFDYCQVAGYRNVMVGNIAVPLPNPCDAIKTALPNNRKGEKHHEALPYQKLPPFIESLRKSNSSFSVKLAFEFTILTASRTSEVLNARWKEFDLEAETWTIPAERMKMNAPHIVPLSCGALEVLKLAKEFNESEFVFPGRPGEPLSNMAMLMALRRMGHTGLTVHGFRATFKTWASERTTFDHLVIEASMAHKVSGIERHYLRTTFPEQRKQLMEAWALFAMTSNAKILKMRA